MVARLARAIEILHAAGVHHGRISADAIVVGGRLFASAKLLRPTVAPEVKSFWSPERTPLDAPSREDDAFAVAHVLFFALTGTKLAVGERPPPLAVFDAGDDALDELVSAALAKEPAARPRDLGELRAELDRWLEGEGATIEEGLPFDDDEAEKALDLSSLPPPPPGTSPGVAARGGKNAGLAGNPALFTVVDEETTLPREDEERKTLPTPEPKPEKKRDKAKARAPKLVPPRISTRPPAQSSAADSAGDTAQADDDPKPKAAEPDSARSAQRAPRSPPRATYLVAAVAVVAVGGYFVAQSLVDGAAPEGAVARADLSAEASASSSVSSSVATTSEPALTTVTAPPSSAPEPHASVALSAAPAATTEDTSRCVASAFPSDTFDGTFTDLSAVCSESEAVAGASRLHEMVVRAGMGRPVTGGMKEWSLLGYYELPTFALIRRTCCPSTKPLSIPSSPDTCPRSMESAITAIAEASPRDEKALTSGLDAMEKAVRCAFRAKAQTRFGKHPKPSGGEGTALRGFAKRLGSRT